MPASAAEEPEEAESHGQREHRGRQLVRGDDPEAERGLGRGACHVLVPQMMVADGVYWISRAGIGSI